VEQGRDTDVDRHSVFDRATAVVPAAEGHSGAIRHWHGTVSPDWSIDGRTNGGYLLAMAVRAALLHAGASAEPLASTGTFLAPAPAGPVELETELLREGRTTLVARARVHAGGAACLEALVTAGALADGEAVVPGPAVPDLPAELECVRLPSRSPAMPMVVPILDVLDLRLDPATLGFARGRPSGAGVLRGWLRMVDGSPFDPLALVMAVDCYPPAVFDLREVDPSWVPTLQLSAFVRGVPAPGPLRVSTLARSVGAGMVDESTDVWDSTGRLVAVGHQLAAVRIRR
jgi:hypothetical protein